MGAPVQPPPFYAGRVGYIPLPRPNTSGKYPYGPNTVGAWPCHRLVHELKWTYAQINAATIAEILDANEVLDVMRDIESPPDWRREK